MGKEGENVEVEEIDMPSENDWKKSLHRAGT